MVGIIGAMEEEVRELIEDMTECEMQERASMKFYKGMLYGKEAVVVQSGIGKVNAAICTQILADFYQVDQLINTGSRFSGCRDQYRRYCCIYRCSRT